VTRRLAALAALTLGMTATALFGLLAVNDLRRGAIPLILLIVALAAGWQVVVRREAIRVAALAAGALLAASAVGLLIALSPVLVLSAISALALGIVLGAHALRGRVPLPPAPRPRRPVLFWNPR